MNSFQWLRAFLILVATCAAVLLLSTSALAEDHGRHNSHKGHKCPVYSEIDANADGSVTSEEFYAFRAARMAARTETGAKMMNAKNAPSFEDLDLDGDGNLSADEFAKHQATFPMRKKNETEEAEAGE